LQSLSMLPRSYFGACGEKCKINKHFYKLKETSVAEVDALKVTYSGHPTNATIVRKSYILSLYLLPFGLPDGRQAPQQKHISVWVLGLARKLDSDTLANPSPIFKVSKSHIRPQYLPLMHSGNKRFNLTISTVQLSRGNCPSPVLSVCVCAPVRECSLYRRCAFKLTAVRTYILCYQTFSDLRPEADERRTASQKPLIAEQPSRAAASIRILE